MGAIDPLRGPESARPARRIQAGPVAIIASRPCAARPVRMPNPEFDIEQHVYGAMTEKRGKLSDLLEYLRK